MTGGHARARCVTQRLTCSLIFQATAYEEVDWFPECTTEIPDAEELSDWMSVGKVSG